MGNKTNGYPTNNHNVPIKRYCQTLELKDSEELITRYREVHSKEQSWKEIRDGIRQVGILEMEIYIFGNRLFMIVDTPLDFDWHAAMSRLATLPRQQEWETFVAQFQKCAADATSEGKWQLMERIFFLY